MRLLRMAVQRTRAVHENVALKSAADDGPSLTGYFHLEERRETDLN